MNLDKQKEIAIFASKIAREKVTADEFTARKLWRGNFRNYLDARYFKIFVF